MCLRDRRGILEELGFELRTAWEEEARHRRPLTFASLTSIGIKIHMQLGIRAARGASSCFVQDPADASLSLRWQLR